MILRDRVFLRRHDVLDTTTTRCHIRPITSTEPDLEGRVAVQTDYAVTFGPRVELSAVGSLRWRGLDYDVQGDLLVHTDGGRIHHQTAVVRRRTG